VPSGRLRKGGAGRSAVAGNPREQRSGHRSPACPLDSPGCCGGGTTGRSVSGYLGAAWATDEDVAALLSLRKLSGQRGSVQDGYDVRGLPPVELLFQAAGSIEQVAPELCGRTGRWRSLTPYLPVRHRKRETLEDYLVADVRTELGYRGLPPAAVMPMAPEPRLPDRWALEFRRYRMTENMSRSRPGLGLRLEFADPVAGPLLLGQLSHFGYGVFVPDESAQGA
jgi:CRISPR-associated protein Csb2